MKTRLAAALGLAAVIAAGCGGSASVPRAETGPATLVSDRVADPGRPSADAGAGSEAPPAGDGQGLRLVRVVSGLDQPVYVAVAPGDAKRLYVVERAGRIRTVAKGRITGTFLDIRKLVSVGSERGLFSVAFHPGYATNRRFYVDYTDLNGDTRVIEYRSRTGGKAPVRVRELLFVDQPFSNHNGGQLQFGPDGLLYVGMGDGGSHGDPAARAQDLSSRFGKLLRADVDVPRPSWEIVGYGLRNPWRFNFDPSGNLWIADVGEERSEEIDMTPADSPGIENYGWNAYEGSLDFEPGTLNPAGTLVFPIYEYSHEVGCSITGGYLYRGGVASAKGRYFFGDYCTGEIWSLVPQAGTATDVREHPFRVPLLTSFGEGRGGALFLVSQAGSVYRLAAK